MVRAEVLPVLAVIDGLGSPAGGFGFVPEDLVRTVTGVIAGVAAAGMVAGDLEGGAFAADHLRPSAIIGAAVLSGASVNSTGFVTNANA